METNKLDLDLIIERIKEKGYITKDMFLSFTKPTELFCVFNTLIECLKHLDKELILSYKDLIVSDYDKYIVSEKIIENWKNYKISVLRGWL